MRSGGGVRLVWLMTQPPSNRRRAAAYATGAIALVLLAAACGDDSEDAVSPEHDSEYCQLARKLREPDSGPRSQMADEDRQALLAAAPDEIRDHLDAALTAVDEKGGEAYFDDESSLDIKAVDDYDVSVCGVPTLEERLSEDNARLAEDQD